MAKCNQLTHLPFKALMCCMHSVSSITLLTHHVRVMQLYLTSTRHNVCCWKQDTSVQHLYHVGSSEQNDFV